MEKYMNIFKAVLLGAEFIAALTAVLYFNKIKNIVWKVFAFYLVYVFLQELYFNLNESIFSISKIHYLAFIGTPIEYVFFYWLFAYNSLKKRDLFFIFSSIYLVSIPIEVLLKEGGVVYSLSFIVGILFLSILLVLEFLKQIKSDEILNFRENKMFYVLVGVILGYITTYPFFAFNNELWNNHRLIWNVYYVFFMCFTTIMYLLFTASFIWGKRQS